jgi:hypothetical protein
MQGVLSPWDRRMIKLIEAFGEPCHWVRMPFTERRRQRRPRLRVDLQLLFGLVNIYDVACFKDPLRRLHS